MIAGNSPFIITVRLLVVGISRVSNVYLHLDDVLVAFCRRCLRCRQREHQIRYAIVVQLRFVRVESHVAPGDAPFIVLARKNTLVKGVFVSISSLV